VNLELAITLLVLGAFGTGLWFAVSGRNRNVATSDNSLNNLPEQNMQQEKSAVPVVPNGLQSVTTYITVNDTAAAVDYYTRAFGAVEQPGRLTAPDGMVMHTTITIDDTAIMIADESLAENSPMNSPSPTTLGGVCFKLNLFVGDAQGVVDRAVSAGGELLMPVSEQFFGHLSGRVRDPFGHHWIISTPVDALDHTEISRRFDDLFS